MRKAPSSTRLIQRGRARLPDEAKQRTARKQGAQRMGTRSAREIDGLGLDWVWVSDPAAHREKIRLRSLSKALGLDVRDELAGGR